MNLGQITCGSLSAEFAGTLAGRAVTLKKEAWVAGQNLLIGMAGAVIGGELFRLV